MGFVRQNPMFAEDIDKLEFVEVISMEEQISLCGKLEAIIGGYFLSGAGLSGPGVEILYYDPSVGEDDTVELIKENIVAYFLADEHMAFVKADL